MLETKLVSASKMLGLWVLFFSISFGFGYTTLHRYNPRATISDAATYSEMVLHWPPYAVPEDTNRFLIPFIAKPFYALVKNHAGTWDPVNFGLLSSASLFVATTCLLLFGLSKSMGNAPTVSLIAALLYLSNFAIGNFQLAGYVDSGEACFLVALAAAIFSERWYLLPILGVLGTAAKETYLPFSCLFAAGWWIAAKCPRQPLKWIAALAVTAVITTAALMTISRGEFSGPWELPSEMFVTSPGLLERLWLCFANRGFWYVFIWLLPLGVYGLRRIYLPWTMGTAFALAFATATCIEYNFGTNTGRILFNVAGPLLSLSAAYTLRDVLLS
jgi:hypothetical protein